MQSRTALHCRRKIYCLFVRLQSGTNLKGRRVRREEAERERERKRSVERVQASG